MQLAFLFADHQFLTWKPLRHFVNFRYRVYLTIELVRAAQQGCCDGRRGLQVFSSCIVMPIGVQRLQEVQNEARDYLRVYHGDLQHNIKQKSNLSFYLFHFVVFADCMKLALVSISNRQFAGTQSSLMSAHSPGSLLLTARACPIRAAVVRLAELILRPVLVECGLISGHITLYGVTWLHRVRNSRAIWCHITSHDE